MWEFPKIRDPDIEPEIDRALTLKDTEEMDPQFMEAAI